MLGCGRFHTQTMPMGWAMHKEMRRLYFCLIPVQPEQTVEDDLKKLPVTDAI